MLNTLEISFFFRSVIDEREAGALIKRERMSVSQRITLDNVTRN